MTQDLFQKIKTNLSLVSLNFPSDNDSEESDDRVTLKEELEEWLELGLWAGLREFADLFPWLVSLSFVGHVSTIDLAALSLVEVWIYTLMDLTWWAVSMTESVLVSQAHGSRCLLSMRGWALMSLIVITISNIFLTILCFTCGETLVAFGFEKAISERGAKFAQYIIPAFYFEGVTICIATYLTAFQEASLPTYIQIVTGVLDLFLTYILIFGIAGFHGINTMKAAALGWVVTSCLSCILEAKALHQMWGQELDDEEDDDQEDKFEIPNDFGIVEFERTTRNQSDSSLHVKPLLYLRDTSHLKHRAGGLRFVCKLPPSGLLIPDTPLLNYRTIQNKNSGASTCQKVEPKGESETSQETFASVLSWIWNHKRWLKYSKQALPNFATTGMQSLSLFLMSMCAAKLGNMQIAAHNSSVALFEVLYTVVQGMGEGTSIRIGYHVGNGDIEAAKQVMWVSFALSLCWGLLAAASGYTFRNEIAGLMSNDPEVKLMLVSLAPLVWGSYAVFSVGGQCLAVLDGQGRASEQAFCFLVGSWLISVPLFLYCAVWTDWGLHGLWVSLILGYFTTVVVTAWYIYTSNWHEIVERSKERIALSPKPPMSHQNSRKNNTLRLKEDCRAPVSSSISSLQLARRTSL